MMTPRASGFLKAGAVACYLIGLGGAAALAGLVLLLGLDLLPERPTLPLPWPWLVNLGWLALFGLQHSGMARAGFKRFWARIIPDCLERSCYVTCSGVVSIALAVTWQPLPGEPLWCLPLWLVVVPLAAGLGMVLVSLCFDHFGFFGLRQAWTCGQPQPPDELLVIGPYRYIRHPLMACQLVYLWAQPVMPLTLALLDAGFTVYVAIGVLLEERDLRRRFGAAYEAYRRRVPAIVPWRSPAPSARYPALPETGP